MTAKCNPTQHHYFVAEVIGVPQEGTAHVLCFCTACGDFVQHTARVAQAGTELRLLREEKRLGQEKQSN